MQNRINCIPFGGHCKIRRETKAVGDDKYVGHEAISWIMPPNDVTWRKSYTYTISYNWI